MSPSARSPDQKSKAETRRPFLFSVERPSSYWDVVGAHLPMAAISGSILLLSFLIPYHTRIPKSCGFLWLTGYPCPFCGFTRAFVAIGHGHLAAALQGCPAAIVIYALVAIVLAWNAAGLLARVRIRREGVLRWNRRGWSVLLLLGAVLLAANWIYRIVNGLK